MIENIDAGLYIIMYIIQNNKNQVIALLKRNGVIVPNNVSSVDLGELVIHTLKVSRSFNADFKQLLNQPKILAVVATLTQENFANMDGDFANIDGKKPDETWTQYFARTTTTPTGTTTKSVDLNTLPSGGTIKTTGTSSVTTKDPILDGQPAQSGFMKYFEEGKSLLDKFLTYNTNTTNAKIAQAQATVAVADKDKTLGGGYDLPKDKDSNTTLYVVLGLLALAGVGASIYFYKKSQS